MVNYLSPAFRAELEKQNALKTFEAMGNALKLPGSSKMKPLEAKSIHSDRLGNFAITWVEGLPELAACRQRADEMGSREGEVVFVDGQRGGAQGLQGFPIGAAHACYRAATCVRLFPGADEGRESQ